MTRYLLASLLVLVGFRGVAAGAPPDSTERKPDYRTAPESALLLGGFVNAGTSDVLAGAEAALLMRTSKSGNFMLGLSANYSIVSYFGSAKNKSSNYTEHKVHCSNLGPTFAWRIGKVLFYTVEPTFLFGKEKRNTTTSYFAGTQPSSKSETKIYDIKTFQLNTGVTWMLPADRQGSYISAKIFFRGESESVVGATAGLSLSAGFKF